MKLTDWEIAAIEMAVRRSLPYMDQASGKALLDKLDRTTAIRLTLAAGSVERPPRHNV